MTLDGRGEGNDGTERNEESGALEGEGLGEGRTTATGEERAENGGGDLQGRRRRHGPGLTSG